MPEILLHYIWQKKAFLPFPQTTTDGKRVEVIDVGIHNADAGPDFFNAKIRINGIIWVGNIEIHVNSSDWFRHHHHTDPAYDNIILHVVKKADKKVYNSQGDAITQCELKYPQDQEQLERWLQDKLALCNFKLEQDPSLLTDSWKTALLNDRICKKNNAIKQLLKIVNHNWEEAFYITLAHNFGFHTNSTPFELTAQQTPLAFLLKHRNNLFQVEAILFGQAGLLNPQTATDDYSKLLLKEYLFLQKKFNLTPIDSYLWKMLRMRPQNFPHVRIAQFAALIHNSEFLFSKIIGTTDLKQLRKFFDIQTSEYWTTHYCFNKKSNSAIKNIGKNAQDLLIINTVMPYQYAYAEYRNNLIGKQNALQLLNHIPAEHNHIIDQWKLLGLNIKNAADSQSFIHLYQNYCLVQRCMHCDVGYQIFTKTTGEDE